MQNCHGKASMDNALFVSVSCHARDPGPCLEKDSKSQHALPRFLRIGEGLNEPHKGLKTDMGKTRREC
jgi:hypothetical protein